MAYTHIAPGIGIYSSENISLENHLALLIEQIRIDKSSMVDEIEELRNLLTTNEINVEDIQHWHDRSDEILNSLIRYKMGCCGDLTGRGIVVLPYSLRRRYRKLYC